MSKKQGVKKGSTQAATYMDKLALKASLHDQEQRYFGRVFMCDMWTILLGRMGYREKRFEKIDEDLTAICNEYSTDILNDAKGDRDIWYLKGALDREIKGYVGKKYVPWAERYGFTPQEPVKMTRLTDIRSMPYTELAKFLATWDAKGKTEAELIVWLMESCEEP